MLPLDFLSLPDSPLSLPELSMRLSFLNLVPIDGFRLSAEGRKMLANAVILIAPFEKMEEFAATPVCDMFIVTSIVSLTTGK